MWLGFLIILNSIALAEPLSPTSVGPQSEAEAPLLWEKGKTSFDQGQFDQAVYYLERLTQRYPSLSHPEALFLLGRSYLNLHRTAEALHPLKSWIAQQAGTPLAIQGKMLLVRTQLLLRHFHEALLLCEEVLKAKIKDPEVLALKAEALMGLNQLSRARQTLDLLTSKNNFQELNLKLHFCQEWLNRNKPSQKLNEAQVREQLNQRGSCLLEAAVWLQKVFKEGVTATATQATQKFHSALKELFQTCHRPPVLPPGSRSQEEIRHFKQELALILKRDCKDNYSKIRDFIEKWEKDLPTSTRSQLKEILNDAASNQARPSNQTATF